MEESNCEVGNCLTERRRQVDVRQVLKSLHRSKSSRPSINSKNGLVTCKLDACSRELSGKIVPSAKLAKSKAQAVAVMIPRNDC